MDNANCCRPLWTDREDWVYFSEDFPRLAHFGTGALLHSLILYLLACDEILFYNLERNLNTKKSRCEFDVCILIDKDS